MKLKQIWVGLQVIFHGPWGRALTFVRYPLTNFYGRFILHNESVWSIDFGTSDKYNRNRRKLNYLD